MDGDTSKYNVRAVSGNRSLARTWKDNAEARLLREREILRST